MISTSSIRDIYIYIYFLLLYCTLVSRIVFVRGDIGWRKGDLEGQRFMEGRLEERRLAKRDHLVEKGLTEDDHLAEHRYNLNYFPFFLVFLTF